MHFKPNFIYRYDESCFPNQISERLHCRMKYLTTCLPLVLFISLHINKMSTRAALIDFKMSQRNRRTLSTTNQVDPLQRYHHSSSLHSSNTISKGCTLPFLTIRGGNSDTTINMSSASSSQPLNAQIFDMERMKIRLDGLSQYAVICALLLNVCLNIHFNTMKYLDNNVSPVQREVRQKGSSIILYYLSQFHYRGMKMVEFVFILSSVFSIVSSAYTAVVFTLLGLYSKAALGMGCDTNFLLFFNSTQKWRESAFDAFFISLMNFEISFLSSLIIAYKGQYRLFIIAVTALCLSYSFYHWVSIITIAGRLLYSTNIPITPTTR